MTETEFMHRWFPHHTAQFTGIVTWLAKVPQKPAPGMPSQMEVLKAWYRQLAGLKVDDAIAASDELASSAEEYQPRSFDRHPAAVLAIVKRLRRDCGEDRRRPRYVDGYETFWCLLCKDTGSVSVWHPKTVAAARAGNLKHPTYSCAVKCGCEASRGMGWNPISFDANTMLPTKPWLPQEEQEAELLAFVAGLDERRLEAKKHREF